MAPGHSWPRGKPLIVESGASCMVGTATNGQVIERDDRIGLRPQTYPTSFESCVAVIEEQGTIKPALDVIIDRDHAQQMPLAECGGFDAGARELLSPGVVGKEPEVVLERAGSDHVIGAVAEPEHDAAGDILRARKRIKFHRDVHVRE